MLRPRPTRNRGVGLCFCCRKNRVFLPNPSFRQGVVRTAHRSTRELSAHPRPDYKQDDCKTRPETSQIACFARARQRRKPAGLESMVAESAGPLASQKAAKRPRRLLSRRRLRASSCNRPLARLASAVAPFAAGKPRPPSAASASTGTTTPRAEPDVRLQGENACKLIFLGAQGAGRRRRCVTRLPERSPLVISPRRSRFCLSQKRHG